MEDAKIKELLEKLIEQGIGLRDVLHKAPLHTYIPTITHNRQYYQIAESWRVRCINLLDLRFKGSLFCEEFKKVISIEYPNGSRYCKDNVERALGVLEAALEAFNTGMTEDLFYQREVVLLSDLLDQAYEFHKNGFDLVATIYGRVVLEMVIKEFASKRNLQKSSFDQTIISLKTAGLISQPLEHALRANYSIGSSATHNQEEFNRVSKQDIKNFLDFIRNKVLTI